VDGEGDVAFICSNCHMTVCKNCVEEYSSSENTPVSPAFPFTENAIFSSSEKNQQDTNQEDTNKQDTNTSKPQSSLLDDYANVNTELPDYFGGDD